MYMSIKKNHMCVIVAKFGNSSLVVQLPLTKIFRNRCLVNMSFLGQRNCIQRRIEDLLHLTDSIHFYAGWT